MGTMEYKFKASDSPVHPEHIGERLARAREAAEKSKAEVCRDLRIDKSAYSKYEKGTRGLPVHTAYELSVYLRVDLNYLLAGQVHSLPLEAARRLNIT